MGLHPLGLLWFRSRRDISDEPSTFIEQWNTHRLHVGFQCIGTGDEELVRDQGRPVKTFGMTCVFMVMRAEVPKTRSGLDVLAYQLH